MSIAGTLYLIFVVIILAYGIRDFYLDSRLSWGGWPSERRGEYEEVIAVLPIVVSGKLIWLRRYRRTFVSTMCGGFVRTWLPK